MDSKKSSPRINNISWGRIEIEGGRSFKDAKLYPGGAREWDWRETGTSHESGVQPGDIEELLEKGANVIVIGKGMNNRLQIHPAAKQLLEDRGIAFHALPTEAAVQLYNDLSEKEAAAGLFHSTC